MGGCMSKKTPEELDALRYSRAVDKLARADYSTEQKKIRLLLLGPGESGKSTIFRQLKLIYGTYSEDDLKIKTPFVYSNIICEMQNMIDQAEKEGLLDDIENKHALDAVQKASEADVINPSLANSLASIWKDPVIESLWARRNTFQVLESLEYFMENIDRISAPDFKATTKDALHVRIRTSGINVDQYSIDGYAFEMYDVGGQRNERKKWIHCFDNVTAVIYVAALSEFDQGMYEDQSANRMKEAIDLFKEICCNPYFQHSSIILFLNKKDLFEKKIQTKHIKDIQHFSDYSGRRGSYEDGVTYFLRRFEAQYRSDKRHYFHVTCATDASNVRVVFTSCKDTILRNALERHFVM